MAGIKAHIFFRYPRPEYNSFEELFKTVLWAFPYSAAYKKIELPFSGADWKTLVRNVRFARAHRGRINHISGDVHYIALATGRNTVLTIHDTYSVIKGNVFKRVLISILWFYLPALIVRRITTISEKSRKELLQVIPFARHKIRVIPNPYNPQLVIGKKAEVLPAPMPEKPVILHIGTKENKNLERTLQALQGLPCHLIILGKLSPAQEQLLAEMSLSYENHFNLPYEEVGRLYHRCDILCFASLYEGFGMPIIEAQLVGKPVLSSNIAPMDWVAADAACLVDPYDPTAIRKGLEKIIRDTPYRETLIRKGRENIRRFEPHTIANMYLEVYRELGA